MGTRAATMDYLLGQLGRAGTVSARRMFGEYALYCEGKVVALVCDDQLYLKPTEAGRAHIGTVTEGLPYPGAKPWFLIGGDRWEDDEWLATLVRLTAAALPARARPARSRPGSAPAKPPRPPRAARAGGKRPAGKPPSGSRR